MKFETMHNANLKLLETRVLIDRLSHDSARPLVINKIVRL